MPLSRYPQTRHSQPAKTWWFYLAHGVQKKRNEKFWQALRWRARSVFPRFSYSLEEWSSYMRSGRDSGVFCPSVSSARTTEVHCPVRLLLFSSEMFSWGFRVAHQFTDFSVASSLRYAVILSSYLPGPAHPCARCFLPCSNWFSSK